MEPTNQTNILRSALIFLIIGAVLLAAVIFGVRFAKSRSETISGKTPTTTSVSQEPASPSKSQKSSESNSQGKDITTSNQPTSSPNLTDATPVNKENNSKTEASAVNNPSPVTSVAPPTPTHVPSTGSNDLLPIFAIAATVFAAATYVQSRRRLARLCL